MTALPHVIDRMNAPNSPSWLQVPVSTTMMASTSRNSSPGAWNRSIGASMALANSYRGPRSLATATRTDLPSWRRAQASPISDPSASPSGRTWVMIRNRWCDRTNSTNGDQSTGMEGGAFRAGVRSIILSPNCLGYGPGGGRGRHHVQGPLVTVTCGRGRRPGRGRDIPECGDHPGRRPGLRRPRLLRPTPRSRPRTWTAWPRRACRLTQFNTPMPVLCPDAGVAADRPLPSAVRPDRQPRPGRRPAGARTPTTSACRSPRSRSRTSSSAAGYATGMRRQVAPRPPAGRVPADQPRVRRVPRHPLQQRHAARSELLDGEQVVEYPVVQATLTRSYTERALRVHRRATRDRPFFLYLPHAMPHKPLAGVGRLLQARAGPACTATRCRSWTPASAEVLAKLKDLGLDERTRW